MKKRTKTKQIIIHCSATKEKVDIDATIITKWHLDRGWSTIGYHYVIKLDGTIEKGRTEYLQGAHCRGQNAESVGICYVGGLDKAGNPKDTRTDKQKKSLLNLIAKLENKYGKLKIRGHRDYNSHKACPCFNVDKEYGDVN